MRIYILFTLLSFLSIFPLQAQQQTHAIRGNVLDKTTRENLQFINVVIWETTKGATTDSTGNYLIKNVRSGTYRLQATAVGYKIYISPEFMVVNKDVEFNIELEENSETLREVKVVAGPYRKPAESPVSLRVIGFSEIEKSAGANRDISRVIQSFPGVASAPSGYRNDLIVRGGGPSENKYYIDGVEIPNINHFSTQGASGGPIGIINAELIRETDFYSGAFPAGKGNALSSILDFRLKEGSGTTRNYNVALGSSEAAFTTDGYIGKKTTYLFSARQSYLQFLFKALKLPFLPAYTDSQFKIKIRFDKKNELTLLGLGAIDNMSLNTDTAGQTEGNKYILTTIPVIRQTTYTLGGVWKHFAGNTVQSYVLSINNLDNKQHKYRNNDDSSEANKILDYASFEREIKFRFENSSQLNHFRLMTGANTELARYFNDTRQSIFTNGNVVNLTYNTDISFFKWGVYTSLNYDSGDGKITVSAGLRTDANTFVGSMSNPLRQLSPRISLAYGITDGWYINGNVGRYYQLPSYTVLGYKNGNGVLVNKANNIRYQRSDQAVIGLERRPTNYIRLTLEGFYKRYTDGLLSVSDGIPLSSKGNDYTLFGTEAVTSTAKGRAYGAEALARWFGYKKLNLIVAYTFVRSEFLQPATGKYIPSSWDNRHLLTLTGSYKLPRNWDIGTKLRVIGGAPYTPYDASKSSLKAAWDAQNRPYYDYSRFNTERNATFCQLDIRIDKTYYFKGWMLGFYLDIQNATNSKNKQAPVLNSTGITDPSDNSRYLMKTIDIENGSIVPSIGIMMQF
ncbi:MAG: putative TonB dependent outer membrane protein [Bacteroidetes bacterium]|nr:putative TonB dependent outer membrane protein [Bacteroidota bacterium]